MSREEGSLCRGLPTWADRRLDNNMVTKSLSLVEQKRLQWAREREELAGLGALWGAPNIASDGYRPCIRTRYVSAVDMTRTDMYLEPPYMEVAAPLQRSPSLPPVHHAGLVDEQQELSRRVVYRRGEYNEEVHSNEEGETSGYASDSNDWQQRQAIKGQRPEKAIRRGLKSQQRVWPTEQGFTSPDSLISTPPHHRAERGEESPPYHRVMRGVSPPYRQWSSGDEATRLKWGDRGIGVGHLWEPSYHEPDCRLPQVEGSERTTPVWLERGLSKLNGAQSGSQILVINHPPSAAEDTPSALSRRLGGSVDTISLHSGVEDRTHIRGQNVPVDPGVLLERETKRQKALELQDAIRQQLEERDRKRKADIERRIREEREEDERIRKERERERHQMEEEQRKKKEKEEKEAQKEKAMKAALENADKVAREERSKANRKHILQNLPEFRKEIQCNECLTSPPGSSCFHDPPVTSQEDRGSSDQAPVVKDTVEVHPGKGQPQARGPAKGKTGGVGVQTVDNKTSDKREGVIIEAEPIMSPEGLPIVLGNDILQGHKMFQGQELVQGQEMQGGVQLALLMSPGLLMEQTNRLLTPSRYRRAGRECATQTDADIVSASLEVRRKAQRKVRMAEREKSSSLERPHRDCKLPLRCRSQSQPRVNLENRPKWGVNRPGTQYRKQSEKDPYYQRRLRKRQGTRAVGGVADTGTDTDTWSSQSRPTRHGHSDYSRSPSPTHSTARTTQPRRNRHLYRRPLKATGIISNDEDKSEKPQESPPLSPIESFEDEDYPPSPQNKTKHGSVIRDRGKYVNALSQREEVEHRTSRKLKDTRSRENVFPKYLVKGEKLLSSRQERLPLTIDTSEKPLAEWGGEDILSQLTSLRNGLMLKQQEWENPRSPTSLSDSSWFSNS